VLKHWKFARTFPRFVVQFQHQRGACPMKKTIILALALVLLSACAPSQQAIQTAIAQTQAAALATALPAATEAPVSAPVSVKDLDLANTIFGPAGVPEGFAVAQSRSAEAAYPDLAGFDVSPVNQSHQDLTFQGGDGSRDSIYLFETAEQAARAYEYVYAKVKGEGQQLEEQLGPGAKSFGYARSVTATPGSKVVFVRCRALVVLESNAEGAYSGLTDHAIGLDERLSDFICG
jgi:hypothetical protein